MVNGWNNFVFNFYTSVLLSNIYLLLLNYCNEIYNVHLVVLGLGYDRKGVIKKQNLKPNFANHNPGYYLQEPEYVFDIPVSF